MGYNAKTILGIATYLHEGVISPGCSILEFGAQEAEGNPEELRASIDEVAAHMGMRPNICVRSPLPMREVYKALGFKHASIDVNGLHGSKFFDLNRDRVPLWQRGAFDFVNNEGTTEHVCNQLNAFKAAHDFCRVGGHIAHSVPLIGWVDHGLANMTLKFWQTMIPENHYQVLKMDLYPSEPKQLPEHHRHLAKTDFRYSDVWLYVLLKKNSSAQFRVPVDHVDDEVRSRLQSRRSFF